MNKDYFNPYKGLSFLMTKISRFVKDDETYLKWEILQTSTSGQIWRIHKHIMRRCSG